LHLTAAKFLPSTVSKVYPASGPGEKVPSYFPFSSYPNKQKTEYQLESNSVTPSLWKASLCHTALKTAKPFLPVSWLQNGLHEMQKK
jgi:hypothetical protein